MQPTQAPADFTICVGFNPSATKGVFVHYDEAASGSSLTGLPGKGFSPFGKGDWLIRAELDQARKSNAPKP